ncbi:MAG: LysR family transcriptional regulator, partial [Gemmatimonadaceae bacterium]|nr:LysR family transcriptional regulator [Acetobacteraceae bacterium]
MPVTTRAKLDTLFPGWDNSAVIDLNDLRVFATVAALLNFSAASRSLGMPKSSVSRSIARLETTLGTRLLQRTTRDVALTEFGAALQERCVDILARLDDTIDYVGSLGTGSPRGVLKVSAGIGFGINVLSGVLPQFLERYPDVQVSLELTSRSVDLVAESVDVAIRLGPMPDSQLVAKRLGSMPRYLCAAPKYLERRGWPRILEDLHDHDAVEMPGVDGRPRRWTFSGDGEARTIEVRPRLTVNEALTIHRLVVNGVGIGCLSGYLCAPDLGTGQIVRLLPEWAMPALEVSVVFPSHRE